MEHMHCNWVASALGRLGYRAALLYEYAYITMYNKADLGQVGPWVKPTWAVMGHAWCGP